VGYGPISINKRDGPGPDCGQGASKGHFQNLKMEKIVRARYSSGRGEGFAEKSGGVRVHSQWIGHGEGKAETPEQLPMGDLLAYLSDKLQEKMEGRKGGISTGVEKEKESNHAVIGQEGHRLGMESELETCSGLRGGS